MIKPQKGLFHKLTTKYILHVVYYWPTCCFL